MKTKRNCFNNFCFTAILALLMVQSPFNAAIAATNGCEEEKNDFINQRLALCSTHAYNIGLTQNPSDNSLKQTMNEVVTLKTTIMTQQMKKQYDYLEVTIKRFKTQLEKAILVSKLEASGAASSESSSSASKSTNKNIVLTGAQDCNMVYNNSDLLTCLTNNLNMISSSSDKANARKQLEKDIEIFGYVASDSNKLQKCANLSTSNMNECVNEFRIKIRSQASANTQRNNNNNNMGYGNMGGGSQ